MRPELTSLIAAGLAGSARSTRETFECCFRDITRLAVVDLARAVRKLVSRCDLCGNQNMSGYTTGTNNELTSGGGYTFTYDKNGNTIGETQLSTGDVWTFGYDDRNRMISAVEKSSGGTTLNQATYTYDALDRRIGVDDNGTQTWTIYNGTSADANPYADFNGSGTLLTRYVSGLAVDELFARTSSGGTTAWYLTDRLGSVRDIVNSSGTVIDHIVYDSYGNILSETSPSNVDRFKFTGMEWDAAIGQYYDHARWYGAGVGRFIQQDPTDFAGGSPNLCEYALNGPTDCTDLSGDDPAPPSPQSPPPTNTSRGLTQQEQNVLYAMYSAIYQEQVNKQQLGEVLASIRLKPYNSITSPEMSKSGYREYAMLARINGMQSITFGNNQYFLSRPVPLPNDMSRMGTISHEFIHSMQSASFPKGQFVQAYIDASIQLYLQTWDAELAYRKNQAEIQASAPSNPNLGVAKSLSFGEPPQLQGGSHEQEVHCSAHGRGTRNLRSDGQE